MPINTRNLVDGGGYAPTVKTGVTHSPIRKTDSTLEKLWQSDYDRFVASGGASGGQSTGSGGRGGSGGGSGMNFNAYQEAMRKFIASMGGAGGQAAGANAFSGIQNPYTGTKSPLTGMINPAVDKDIAAAKQAFGQVAGGVSMDDPYAAQRNTAAPTVDPRLAAFAQSQGVGAAQQGAVGVAQQNANNTAANWQGLAGALGANHVAGQQNIVDMARQQEAQTVAGYEGQRTALQAQDAVRQQALDLQAKGFDASLAMQIAQAQMGLDGEARQSEASALEARRQMILQLINAAAQSGQAPNLEGLV